MAEKLSLRVTDGDTTPKSYGIFEKTFFDVVDHHSLEKKKSVRDNHKLLIAIMKRSELATKLKVEPTDFNKKNLLRTKKSF